MPSVYEILGVSTDRHYRIAERQVRYRDKGQALLWVAEFLKQPNRQATVTEIRADGTRGAVRVFGGSRRVTVRAARKAS